MAKAKRKLCFIVNPIAGNGKNKDYCSDLMEEIKSTEVDLISIDTQYHGHGSELAKEYAKSASCTLVSVGGDGTFNEIASSLIHSKAQLAIIPRGSGNGLARMIKVPERKKEQARYLLNGKVQPVDAGKVNDKLFFTTCGFGFDAHIAAIFNKGKLRGGQRYVRQILRQLMSYNAVEAEFTIDGREFKGKYFLVTFSNANQYGNNAYIAPDADLSDGKLHATIIHPFPQVLAPVMTTALLGGFINKMPFVETISMKEAHIKSVSSNVFHCDGESLEMEYPSTIKVLHKALKLIVPKNFSNKVRPYPRMEDFNKQFEFLFKQEYDIFATNKKSK